MLEDYNMEKMFVGLCSEDELLDRFFEKRKVRHAPIWMLLDANGVILGITVDAPYFVSESKGEELAVEDIEEQIEHSRSLKEMLDEVGILPAEKD